MDTIPHGLPLNHINFDEIQSRIKELEECELQLEVANNLSEDSGLDSQQHVKQCIVELEEIVRRTVEECSDISSLGYDDLDAYLKHLRKELNETESECAKMSIEIDLISKENLNDSIQFEHNLEALKCAIEHMQSQVFEEETYEADESKLQTMEDNQSEIREVPDQVEENDAPSNSLKNFNNLFERLDAIKGIEDLFSSIEVLDFDGTSIQLSLKTYVQELIDQNVETSEVNHDLLITVDRGSMELNSVKIFPNDVYIDEIFHASKSFRQSVPQLAFSQTRTSLEWFVGKVQDRVAQCALRQSTVKKLNQNSRFIFQYVDRDECITVPLARQFVASIKVNPSWPRSSGSLKLVSLEHPSPHFKEEPLNLLQIVQESLNSLDAKVRGDLPSFADAIDGALKLVGRGIHS